MCFSTQHSPPDSSHQWSCQGVNLQQLSLVLGLSCAGSDAVMPETLGSQITIERRLQRSGAAPYTVKDELGRKVSACKVARCDWQPFQDLWWLTGSLTT